VSSTERRRALIADTKSAADRYYALLRTAASRPASAHLTVEEELDIQFARDDMQASYKAMHALTVEVGV
jgi:hypothetical protein